MILSQHSGKSLAHQSGAWEPQRTNNFAVVISGLQDVEKLVLSTKSIGLPGPGITKQSIRYFNEATHYAGGVEPVEDATISFRDYVDIDVIPILSAWFKLVWDPENGSIGWAKDYKKSGEVFLLPPSLPGGGGVPATAFRNRVWALTGVFPIKFKYAQLDHDGTGENALIEMTLSVDRALPASMGRV